MFLFRPQMTMADMSQFQESILRSCADGDLATLQNALENFESSRKILPSYGQMLKAAAEKGQDSVVQYLIKRNMQTKDSFTFHRDFIIQVLNGGPVALECLRKHDANVLTADLGHFGDPLAVASFTNNVDLVSYLLAQGVDPNGSKILGRPAIEQAAGYSTKDIVSLLLQNGAKFEGTNALLQAFLNGRVDILKMLLEQGDDVNIIQGVDGWAEEHNTVPGPILHSAISKRDTNVVRMLLNEFKADPMAKDTEGVTAIQRAEATGDREIIRMVKGA